MDYEKAFDSLDRESLWELMRHYAIPEKYVTLICNTYADMTCKVTHAGKISAGFVVLTQWSQAGMSPITVPVPVGY